MKRLLFLVFFIAGCDVQHKDYAVDAGPAGYARIDERLVAYEVKERCINGVSYYIHGRRMAPAFKPDGSLYLCGG